jgi:hypothetical protein
MNFYVDERGFEGAYTHGAPSFRIRKLLSQEELVRY